MKFETAHAVYDYTDTGGVGAPLVLLHGFTGTSATWEHFMKTASVSLRVIALDMPGHGRTGGAADVTMEQFSADLAALLASLSISEYHLAGYSMGGRAALFHACCRPEGIRSLVLESSSPGLETEKERVERKKHDELLAERIISEGVPRFTDFWEALPLFESQRRLPTSAREKIRSERLGQKAEGLAASLRGMGTGKQPSLWNRLSGVSMPVLLLAGELDQKFMRLAKRMEQKLPNGRINIISGAGHAIHVEKPEEFDKVVMEFVTAST